MYCYQCQETAEGKCCTKVGVCGKNEITSNLQDLLLYMTQEIAKVVVENSIDVNEINKFNREVLNAIFMTITNANFDEDAIELEVKKLVQIRDELIRFINKCDEYHKISFDNIEEMCKKAKTVGVLSIENEDIRSLKNLILLGIKGMAAYVKHAANLGFEDPSIYQFIYETLNSLINDQLTNEDLFALTLKTGDFGVKTMALLDKANTSTYGNPEISTVNIGVRNNPAILISGHDLKDLEILLEQTKGTGVDVYTHGEMLPANYYPLFKKYDNLVGNYGNAWWNQLDEFKSFNGPILFTTNCIVPPKDKEVQNRIFTTGSAGYPNCKHIEEDENGRKDFSEIINLAKILPTPVAIEEGTIVGGFAHNQVLSMGDKIVEAVKSGAIKKFVVMAGCDGKMKSRSYYTDFAERLPKDCVILTAGCAKYRYNKLNLGDINGIPRVLDAGQCNDSYSLVVIALALKDIFGLDDLNKLPIVYNIAWYEQKAVIVLLALLSLGVKNIHLGPTLPAFLSPNVTKVLVENFGIAGITNVDDDMKKLILQ